MASARQTLRLPAPPPKRQRTAGGSVHDARQPPGATAAAATAAGAPPPPAPPPAAAAVDDDEEAWELDAPGAVPNDAVAALQLLRTRFPVEARTAPFATKAQLYTLLPDRTAADRALEEARRGNAVRLLQLPSGRDEFAVMLTEDYAAALAAAKAAQLAKSSGGGGGGESGSSAAQAPAPTAAAAAAAQVFDWFGQRVLPACTDVMVTHAELLALLAGGGGGGGGGAAPRPRPGSSAPAAAAAAAAAGVAARPAGAAARPPDHVTDAHVSLLLSHGFLTRHTGGPDVYLFSMPNAGAAVRSVPAGRAEVLGLLQRRRQPELLEAELLKRKLQRSVLGVRWHIADMVGSGALLRLDTTVGPLLRVARRAG